MGKGEGAAQNAANAAKGNAQKLDADKKHEQNLAAQNAQTKAQTDGNKLMGELISKGVTQPNTAPPAAPSGGAV